MAEEPSTFREAIRYSHLGLTMVVIGGLFFWGGLQADAYFGWSPWGMLGGLFLGILSAMAYFVNQVRQMGRKLREETADEGEPGPHGDDTG